MGIPVGNGFQEAKLLKDKKLELVVKFRGEQKFSETGAVYTFDDWKTQGNLTRYSSYGGEQHMLIDLTNVELPAVLQFAAYLRDPNFPTEWDSKYGENYKANVTKDEIIPLNY